MRAVRVSGLTLSALARVALAGALAGCAGAPDSAPEQGSEDPSATDAGISPGIRAEDGWFRKECRSGRWSRECGWYPHESPAWQPHPKPHR
jgi:hypothetical protein